MRVLRSLLAVFVVLLAGLPAIAQTTDGRTVEFIEMSGILDDRVLRFGIESIEEAAERGDTEVVVLMIDSPGVVGSPETFEELRRLVESPPLPVISWIGPAPAKAYGGAALLAFTAQVRMAAPGSEVGLMDPTVAGEDGYSGHLPDATVEVAEEPLLWVSEMTAAPRQVVQLLDGLTFTHAGGEVTLSTLVEVEGGETILTVVRSPGWWDAFLRLASTPEAAFFLLVAALTVAAFEFYAIGPGIAAGVAAVSLFLAGYGIAVLPVRWWAVGLTLASVWLLAVAYQRGSVLALNLVGLAGLTVAGFSFTKAAPQFSPGIPGVLLTIGSAAFFFLLAMPTVARSRFSTQTIGRNHLIGRSGKASTDLGPDGVVEVDGAKWRATSHREAGIRRNDPVVVTAVEGWFLEVEPPG